MSKISPFEVPISPVSGLLAPEKVIRWPQVTRFSQECPIWVVTTSKMPFGPCIWYFRTFYGSKGALFTHKMVLWEPLEGGQRSGNGSLMPTLLTWASWTFMWCLEPILVPYKSPEGQKVPFRSQADPPRPPKTPPNPLKTPPKPSKTQ